MAKKLIIWARTWKRKKAAALRPAFAGFFKDCFKCSARVLQGFLCRVYGCSLQCGLWLCSLFTQSGALCLMLGWEELGIALLHYCVSPSFMVPTHLYHLETTSEICAISLLQVRVREYMGVSENRGPQYSTLNSRILIIRTPK